jgi:hypothetical protein
VITEVAEEGDHLGILEKGDQPVQWPFAGRILEYLMNSQEACMAGERAKTCNWGQIQYGLSDQCKDFEFYSEWNGKSLERRVETSDTV